jgi:hypothetical protein
MSGIERRVGRPPGRPRLLLGTSLLLLWPLVTPKLAEAKPAGPEPERVYQQLRRDPVIHTRQEAVKRLSEAPPDELRRSAKLAVDKRIRDVLAHEGFGSLDREIRESLHASMLAIRSSFWSQGMEQLSARKRALQELLESQKLVSVARAAEELEARVLKLVEELRMALALERCMRAREKQDWGAAGTLGCLLNGGPDD